MIQLEQLSYQTKGANCLLHDITLTVKPGEFVVISGASGSGKSTLLNVLNGLIPELYEGTVHGSGAIGTSEFPIEDFHQHVAQLGMVFQNPKTHFFTTDVFSELAFVMENQGVAPADIQTRAQQVLQEFQLEAFQTTSMFQLSGGQRQLVSIAAANMFKHQLLLLDEPSSNLDQAAIERLQLALHRLKKQGMPIIIAEHRLAYLMQLADRLLVMEKGTIAKEFHQAELSAISETQRQALGLRSLRSIKMEEMITQSLSKPIRKPTLQLTIDRLVCHYRKQAKPALTVQHLQIENTGIIGLFGKNGSGKTTFFQAISGLMKPKQGSIYLNQQKMSRKQLIAETFFVMQDVNLQLFFETVRKELLEKAKKPERFDEICTTFHLTPLLDRHPHTLSGGEKQRVAIATALLSGKRILLFDEPTSGLDYLHMTEVSHMLRQLQLEEVLIMVISHDEEFLAKTCTSILMLEAGRLQSV